LRPHRYLHSFPTRRSSELVLLLIRFVCASAETHVLQNTGQKIMYDMRMQVFRHLHTLAPAFYDKNPVGRLITRVITDVDVLNELDRKSTRLNSSHLVISYA